MRIRDAGCFISLRWTPHPLMVTIRDNEEYIRVLLYSYYTTITGWGVFLTFHPNNPREESGFWRALRGALSNPLR